MTAYDLQQMLQAIEANGVSLLDVTVRFSGDRVYDINSAELTSKEILKAEESYMSLLSNRQITLTLTEITHS